MACPYFLPQGKLAVGLWVHEPRWPLGTAYSGVCRSHPGEVYEPPERHQEEFCNCGYVRGLCEHFPAESPADAVRFSIASNDGLQLEIVYVIETEHTPKEFGALEFSIERGEVVYAHSDPVLTAQAQAFANAHLLRTGTARAAISNVVL